MKDERNRNDACAPLDPGDLRGSLGLLLRIAQVDVFEEFYRTLGPLGMKPGEFSVLWLIHLNPQVRQGALAGHLRIKRAHMTKLIRRFEADGYVHRQTPDRDRRAVELSLTAKGRAFVTCNADAVFDHIATETARLSPDEADTLVALLQKFTGMEQPT